MDGVFPLKALTVNELYRKLGISEFAVAGDIAEPHIERLLTEIVDHIVKLEREVGEDGKVLATLIPAVAENVSRFEQLEKRVAWSL